ncbi:MAG: hypothetical protein ACOX8R_03125 [Bacillota bacterium]|jgi:hypothetical protein
MCVLKDIAKKIQEEKTSYSYGDKWLYQMCHSKDIKEYDKEELASIIWLIGRSYSASPERQMKLKDDEKNANVFFKQIAKTTKEFFEEKELLESAKEQGLIYSYNSSDSDIEILKKYTKLVLDLNKKYKEDDSFQKNGNKEKNENKKNMISFCSKYLHFFFPGSVFIMDSYSKDGTTRLFHPRVQNKTLEKEIRVKEDTVKIKDLRDVLKKEREEFDNMKEKILEIDNKKEFSDYIDHVAGCYLLGAYLKELEGIKISDSKISMPRLVDSLLLKVGEAK